jgi:hypothetical protein
MGFSGRIEWSKKIPDNPLKSPQCLDFQGVWGYSSRFELGASALFFIFGKLNLAAPHFEPARMASTAMPGGSNEI